MPTTLYKSLIIRFMAEREKFSSASYRKSCDTNDLENNSYIFFLLSEVSIVC